MLHFAFSVRLLVCPVRGFEFEHRAPQPAASLAVPSAFSPAAMWALPLAAHLARVSSITVLRHSSSTVFNVARRRGFCGRSLPCLFSVAHRFLADRSS